MRMSVVMAAAVLAAVSVGGAASAACKINQIGEIQVRMDGNAPLMAGEINGKPVDMLADTGANKSVLFHGSLARLGIRGYEILGGKFYGVGGVAKMAKANVESMKVGSISTHDLGLYVVGREATSDSSVAGALGADFFSQADIEFDFAHHVIRFLKPVGCKGEEVLYWPGAFSELPLVDAADGGSEFAVTVKINGQPVHALLDTGATSSTVTWPMAHALGIQKSALRPLKGAVHGIGPDAVPLSAATFDSFAFDQESVKNVQIEVSDLFVANTELGHDSRLQAPVLVGPEMLLGADFFLSHRVLISQSQHTVFVSYSGGKLFQVGDPDESVK